jgi:hypothetical protein
VCNVRKTCGSCSFTISINALISVDRLHHHMTSPMRRSHMPHRLIAVAQASDWCRFGSNNWRRSPDTAHQRRPRTVADEGGKDSRAAHIQVRPDPLAK